MIGRAYLKTPINRQTTKGFISIRVVKLNVNMDEEQRLQKVICKKIVRDGGIWTAIDVEVAENENTDKCADLTADPQVGGCIF